MPPPSYDSIVIDLEEQNELQQRQRQRRQEEQEGEQPQAQLQIQPQIELNGREIHELDSRQMLPTAELDSINYDTRPTDMPVTSDRHIAPPRVMTHPQRDTFSKPADHQIRFHDNDNSMPPPNSTPSSSGSGRPSLALDTHIDRYRNLPRTKYLSPSSSLRSTKSSQNVSPVTPWTASSGSSGAWTMSSSIDTTMTSPITPFGPNDMPPISQPEGVLATEEATAACPDDDCNYMIDNIPELPGDDPLSIPRGLSDPLLFSFDPKDDYSWMQSVSTELSLGTSVNMMFTDSSNKPTGIPPGFLEPPDRHSETRALVGSAWDALQEHVTSSISKLSHVEDNPLVERLRAQTAKGVALNGLSTLKRILQGDELADPLDYICFIHLVYAMSLIVHGDELMVRCDLLYQQALSYRRFLSPAYLEDYTQIVTTIWEPASNEQSQTEDTALGGSSNYKGKQPDYRTESRLDVGSDPLVAVGQNFLDDIENSVIIGGSQKTNEIANSDLWSTHALEFHPESYDNRPFKAAVNFIIQTLIQKYYDYEVLLAKLRETGQKVHSGSITCVRKLELAILQAGKNTLDSSHLFDEFIPQVRRLCDPIYSEPGFHSRTSYQILGVSLVEALVQNIASDPQHLSESVTFPLGFQPDTYNDFLETLHETFNDPGGIGDVFLENIAASASQHQAELTATQGFESAINPGTYQDVSSSEQGPATAPKSYTTTTSHTGTPSNFTASPDLSRPMAVPTPPKASTPAGAGASPNPNSTTPKVEANDACEICGYRPKGDPQWFKGSMAKHKKMQHSTGPPVIYKCPYPGCHSQYKNRQDNLRQHQIEKNHFVGDEAGRRPSKRKKISSD